MPNDDTIKLLNECNSGIKMGVQGINEVMDNAEDKQLIDILNKYLKEKFPNSFIIFSVYIDRSMDDRINCGIAQQRCERDLNRIEIPLNEYDYVIHNNYSLEEFKQKVKQLTLSLLK